MLIAKDLKPCHPELIKKLEKGEMRIISITGNQAALVDDCDYEYLNRWKWQLKKGSRTYYAERPAGSKRNREKIIMHRLILGLSKGDGVIVDHRNRNGLDNRRSNLRIATHQQNSANSRKHSDASMSRYKGVYWEADRCKWRAYIYFTNQSGVKKKIWLGRFDREEDAAAAYNHKAVELFGTFASPNNIRGYGSSWGRVPS